MNYIEMTDFEINKAVAEIIFPGKEFTVAYSFGHRDGPHVQWIQGYGEFLLKDFCNSWTDAGPIIEENRISIVEQAEGWCAEGRGIYPIPDKNPLRAAMITFLMMREESCTN